MRCSPLFYPFYALLLCAVNQSSSAEPPKFGPWKGFQPGDYVIEKNTYRGLSFRKDGVEYRKTVLLGASKAGAPGFYDYSSDSPEGPWIPGKTSWSDATDIDERARLETKELPREEIKIGALIVPCRVVWSKITRDRGTKTRTQWIDDSGLDLRCEDSFHEQDAQGHVNEWTLSRITTGVETVKVGNEQLSCFVQEQKQSLGSRELRWQESVSAKVPGRRVTSRSWSKKEGLPDVETSLVAWGHDPALVANFKSRAPSLGIITEEEIERREQLRNEKETQNAAKVAELEVRTLADLKHADASKRLSAVNCLASWSISEPNKDAAIQGLKNALDDPSVEVRRLASWKVGQRGVKGMTKRILELLRDDPAGAFQYLDGLGLQAEPAGLPTIIEFTSSSNQFWRKAAVLALQNYRTDEARVALEKTVGDPYWEVRLQTVESLGKIGDSRSTPVLLKALHDENTLVTTVAARMLGQLGTKEAIPALKNYLSTCPSEEKPSVRHAIEEIEARGNR